MDGHVVLIDFEIVSNIYSDDQRSSDPWIGTGFALNFRSDISAELYLQPWESNSDPTRQAINQVE
jgi:hypothetical protein